MGKRAFAVGRITSRSTLVLVLRNGHWRVPGTWPPGPWTLQAVISTN